MPNRKRTIAAEKPSLSPRGCASRSLQSRPSSIFTLPPFKSTLTLLFFTVHPSVRGVISRRFGTQWASFAATTMTICRQSKLNFTTPTRTTRSTRRTTWTTRWRPCPRRLCCSPARRRTICRGGRKRERCEVWERSIVDQGERARETDGLAGRWPLG